MEEAADRWQAPDPQYVTSLRLLVVLVHALPLVALMLAFVMARTAAAVDVPMVIHLAPFIVPLVLLSLIWFGFFWAAKRAKHLRYRVRSLDINLTRGYLFRHDVAVSFNRIQHVEVSQSPVERLFKLGTLKVFTAGTVGSDLHLPGLSYRVAQRLKAEILNEINLEEYEGEPSVNA